MACPNAGPPGGSRHRARLGAPPIFAATRACSSRPSRHPSTSRNAIDLVELIDIAERVNPETRVTWERARQAAIGLGLVESEYFPVLTLSALGGYQSEAFPLPRMSLPAVSFAFDPERPSYAQSALAAPRLRPSGSALDAAKERLLAANLGFNRKHQEIIFRCPARISRADQHPREDRALLRAPSIPPAPSASRRKRKCGMDWRLFRRSLSTAAGSAGRLRPGGRACDRTRCPGGAGGEHWDPANDPIQVPISPPCLRPRRWRTPPIR